VWMPLVLEIWAHAPGCSCYWLREVGGQWFLPGIRTCLECSGLTWKVWILLSFLESMTTVCSCMISPLNGRHGAGYHTCSLPPWWQVSVGQVYLDSLGAVLADFTPRQTSPGPLLRRQRATQVLSVCQHFSIIHCVQGILGKLCH